MKDQIEDILSQFGNDGDFTGAVNRIDLLIKTKPKKKKNPYFVKCMELWFEFFVKQSNGIRPKVTVAHGKALNELIQYFQENYPNTTPDKCLEAIFNNWNKLDAFWQKSIDLLSLSRNLNTILPTIKNPTNGKPSYKTQHDITAERIAESKNESEQRLAELLSKINDGTENTFDSNNGN